MARTARWSSLNLESRSFLEEVTETDAAAAPLPGPSPAHARGSATITVGASGVVGRPFFQRRIAYCTRADTRRAAARTDRLLNAAALTVTDAAPTAVSLLAHGRRARPGPAGCDTND
jgi:hypothetical protein